MKMENIHCSLCFTLDRKTVNIINTHLQKAYENIAGFDLHEDMFLCFVCRTRLRQCHQFWQQVHQADVCLQTKGKDSHKLKSLVELSSVKVINISIPSEEDKEECADKQEDSVAEQDKSEMKIDFDKCDDFTNSSDSEDDIPLKDIRIKQETESGETSKTEVDTEDDALEAREVTLSEAEQRAEFLARAAGGGYARAPYKCELCYRGFVDPAAYDKHREKHDERAGAHACSICRLRYNSGRQLRAHAAAAHARRYLCARCPYRAHTRNQAKEHERWHRGHTYRCEPCGLQFNKPTTYMTHVRKRHAGPHACVRCGDNFVSEHGLRLHAAKSHARAPPAELEADVEVRCLECGVRFLSEPARRRHLLTAPRHSLWADTGACVLCGVVTHADQRGAHVRSHRAEFTTRPPSPAMRPTLRCDQCGAPSSSASNLRAHVRRVHLGERAERGHVCELCGARFTSNATLRYHQRRHTGERPHACECGARFALAAALRVHARTHSGERPYRCGVCGKRFSQKPALNKHYRVHTGAKPYECTLCARAFSQTNSLKIHVRAVHLKLPHSRRRADRSGRDAELTQ